MRCIRNLALASTSLLSLATPAMAQNTGSTGSGASESDQIIVTARRRDESLQDVPMTVGVVTSETLEKLNIQNFEDIETVVPGLTLNNAGNGFGTTASVRGATFNVETGAKDTVVFYQNEVVLSANILFNSLFDIGQIELLRGPQGTVRGRSAPSGALTVTTRRPNLSEYGGSANLSVTERGDFNGQVAVGGPIINDVLGIRIAGVFDDNDFGGVRSINSSKKPYSKTRAARVSLRFEPSTTFRANIMYQHMDKKTSRFTAVFGNGSPGGIVPAYALGSIPYPSRPAPPAGYNGPRIAPGDFLAVQEDPVNIHQVFHTLTGNIEWDFAGQRLSYVGGYSKQSTDSFGGGDVFNQYPGGLGQVLNNDNSYTSHEVRLSSIERIAGIFDYTAGVFYLQEANQLDTRQLSFNPGTFGPVPANTTIPQPLNAPDPAYIQTISIRGVGKTKETSLFGSVTAHLSDKTEITGGIRRITWKERPVGPFKGDVPDADLFGKGNSLCLSRGLIRLPPSFGGGSITTGPLCLDGASRPVVDASAWVWNLSASHKFSDDIMVFATAGTSWRSGPFSVAPHELSAPGFASSNDLRFHTPEKSTSYELGVKTAFADKRGRLNIAVYYQTFKDYFYFSNDTRRLGLTAGVPNSGTGTFNYTANADAKIRGVDLEAGFQINPNWDLSAAFSWAKGNIDNDFVPCNDGNFDGTADTIVPTAANFIAAGVIVARCRSSDSISRSTRWNMSVQSEYAHPVSDRVSAFLRGQLTIYPSNPFKTALMKIDGYGLLNLFAGIRSPDRTWEANIYARNLLNVRQLLDLGISTPSREFGQSGYNTFEYTSRREFGLNLRYSFGSR